MSTSPHEWPPQNLLTAEGLEKWYGGRRLFEGISLSLCAGRIIGIVGENGSGKSTLLRCLLGIEGFQKGTVTAAERPGYCPQEDYLNPRYTVREHIGLALAGYATLRRASVGFVEELLGRFLLGSCLNERISRLSGGTYQKVKFVTSILHEPRVVLLDEPYDGLDRKMYRIFWETLKLLRDRGSAILLVTHLLFEQEPFDAVSSLEGGRLVAAS